MALGDTTMNGIILSTGVLLTAWGLLWRLCDRRAAAAMSILGIATACMLIGSMLP